MNKNIKISGGCFCGNIRYEITDEVIKTGVCHCHSCQHLSGGSSWPFIVVKTEAIKISGNLKEFSRVGGSGHKIHAGFCPECSTTLFGRPELWPHILTVSASSLDKSKEFMPSMHAWTEDAQLWVLFNPDLPKFAQNPINKTEES
jgi:hypothetical protein